MQAGFWDLVAWLFRWRGGRSPGPAAYSVPAMDVFGAGAVLAEVRLAGAESSDVFVSGRVAGEVAP
ncbi:MAG: hypothetical protein JW809_14880 [Pirellulales bacterium]|nr:hypothetical protein [Pirellulales bacterium]